MSATEHQFNTAEQVEDYLTAALMITEACDVPDDLRVAFFTKAADLISGKQVFVQPPAAMRILGG